MRNACKSHVRKSQLRAFQSGGEKVCGKNKGGRERKRERVREREREGERERERE